MGKIIAFGSTKGGAGKSTLATSLAIVMGKVFKTVLVDCDSQLSASEWADIRDENTKLENIKHLQKTGRIKTTLLGLKPDYDFIICDTGGHDASSELRQALTIADLVVVPLRPSQADLNALRNMVELIEDAQEVANADLKALYIINAANSNSRSKKLVEVKEALNGTDAITLANTVIYNRDAYVAAIGSGEGVTELKDKKAFGEFIEFTDEVLKQFKDKKYGVKRREIRNKTKKTKTA
ncbi:AAA family ATPase [Piscirickettsia salmonis]|uniref:AAA family ATPase n=1 Tax=Piscirickettsia salmonis TaxID=1238 RepID=UPI001E2A9C71|nr:AAA family ATPase [Piscirickettsia salmonis]QGP57181.1 ParA-like protein [Piscirickettsia salmonis]QGP62044.1 ParA-like protein [Piscirickettsia salmonis]QGP66718.1 ParA-like protein [Piscirickettsia salmonis]